MCSSHSCDVVDQKKKGSFEKGGIVRFCVVLTCGGKEKSCPRCVHPEQTSCPLRKSKLEGVCEMCAYVIAMDRMRCRSLKRR